MMELMRQVEHIVAPPDRPDKVLGTRTSPKLGSIVDLPVDYLEFIGTYGAGTLCTAAGVTYVWDLTGADGADAQFYIDSFRQNVEIQRQYMDIEEEYSFFPDANGLLPWGHDDDCYQFYWRTASRSDDWQVAIFDRVNLLVTGLGFLEFIYRSLTRQYAAGKYLHLDKPSYGIKYVPRSIVSSGNVDWSFWQSLR
jgi:hypothetical protein